MDTKAIAAVFLAHLRQIMTWPRNTTMKTTTPDVMCVIYMLILVEKAVRCIARSMWGLLYGFAVIHAVGIVGTKYSLSRTIKSGKT